MKRLLKLAIRVLVLIGALLFAYLAVTFVQVWLASRRDEARPSRLEPRRCLAWFGGRARRWQKLVEEIPLIRLSGRGTPP